MSSIKKRLERGAEPLNPVRHERHASWIRSVLVDSSDELTAAFIRVTRSSFVERIEMRFGVSGPTSLDTVVRLKGGRHAFPQQIFSEGYLDLLAVLIFVTMTRKSSEFGGAKVLVLDDVFQSVDSSVRRGVVDYILTSCKDWQLIFTVHDRLWLELLRALFRQNGHPFVERHLDAWSYETGPALRVSSDVSSLLGELERARLSRDPATVCGTAGRVLEAICGFLSVGLPTSVERRPGDRYTLGDLWPGVAKALRKTLAGPDVARLETLVGLRNVAGAHYNEWATALPLSEADAFCDAVASLLNLVYCPSCSDWVRNKAQPRCPCGARTL